MAIVAGTRLDRYEILSPLGAGGMGEVYLARDSRLERKIALKLLPAEFTRDAVRLHRFELEAKAASALNHPNIITIHEIGEIESRHFIATEYIDGPTLRYIISSEKPALQMLLDIAIQTASALAAAHEAGIIHRDIKPENVMIRRDGYVKVLDFGLAKLTERRTSEADAEAPTLSLQETDPGVVMGTANYMSPEQIRGIKVDKRTDIFSLGVLIYEMVTGHAPFNGMSAADVMAEILNREPPPLGSFAPAIPAELQRIVSKSLRKDREERYQTIKDMLLDLKSLKRELELNATVAYSTPSGSAKKTNAAVNYETAVIQSAEATSSQPTLEATPRAVSSAEYLITQVSRRKFGALAALGAIGATAAGLFWLSNNSDEIDSIAVLPFINMNTAADAQLLGDAITDDIINNLSQLSTLNVKSRSSVLQFRGREVDAKEVAKALDVRAVLTGRIVQRGDNLSVSVALVDARDNRHLWGEQYDRKFADLMLIQQEISRDVSDKMRLKLSGDEKRHMEAHQLYVRGRNAWSKRTAENMREGIRYFEQAVQIDPTYAPAYAGLADCYNMLVNYSAVPGKEAFPKSKAAAVKALELDDSLAEAHAALAFIHFQWEWNWAEAEREFRRAIELKPNYATAHQWLSSMLAVVGRKDEAIAEAKRAQEMEPFSLVISAQVGWVNYLARKYEESVRSSEQTLKMDPNFFVALRYQALALEQQGKYPEAIAGFEKVVSLSRNSALLKAELAHVYASAGKRNEAQKIIAELQEAAGRQYISAYLPALIYTGLGDKERAIELLNKALDEKAERLPYVNADPRFDKLRDDPRFKALLENLGLK